MTFLGNGIQYINTDWIIGQLLQMPFIDHINAQFSIYSHYYYLLNQMNWNYSWY